jgi:hypothetical protein
MVLDPTEKKALGWGFLASSVVAAILFPGFTYSTETAGLQSAGYFGILLLVGVLFSAIVCSVLALPAFFLLRWIVNPTAWWALFTGAVAGFIMAICTEWEPNSLKELLTFNWRAHPVGRALEFTIIGGVSGMSFWWAYRQRLRNPKR